MFCAWKAQATAKNELIEQPEILSPAEIYFRKTSYSRKNIQARIIFYF
jgi:hypothetical protein